MNPFEILWREVSKKKFKTVAIKPKRDSFLKYIRKRKTGLKKLKDNKLQTLTYQQKYILKEAEVVKDKLCETNAEHEDNIKTK